VKIAHSLLSLFRENRKSHDEDSGGFLDEIND